MYMYHTHTHTHTHTLYIQGRAFISKPEEVVFKDFELGRVYRKKLQLTNVSYTVNHCRLVGVSLHLRDFITVEFRPPGSMSAGLTCSMSVTFEPKVCACVIHVRCSITVRTSYIGTCKQRRVKNELKR